MTLITLRRESGSHWYDRDGKPRHEIVGKNGALRSTTLRDARKNGWVPSVSEVCSVMSKPGIERWNLRLHLEEALTHPTGDPDDVVRRVRERKAEAPDLGTLYHRDLEALARSGWHDDADAEVLPEQVKRKIIDQAREYGLGAERIEHTFAHPLGYGGTIDLIGWWFPPDCGEFGEAVLIDWKTTETGGRKTLKAWPDNLLQLAAYANGYGDPRASLVNVVISRNEPDRDPLWHRWTAEESRGAFDVFRCLLQVWQWSKGYDSSW